MQHTNQDRAMGIRRHEGFMLQALVQAEQALEAGDFPVGCVIVDQHRVVAAGRRINSTGRPNEVDHAEILALRSFLEKGTGTDPAQLTVYSTMEPCLMCFATLILNGIRTIVYAYEDAMGGGTNVPLQDMNPLYRQMKIAVIPHILRRESHALFVRFFGRPENSYWRNSLLAEYTLAEGTVRGRRG